MNYSGLQRQDDGSQFVVFRRGKRQHIFLFLVGPDACFMTFGAHWAWEWASGFQYLGQGARSRSFDPKRERRQEDSRRSIRRPNGMGRTVYTL